jgi:hypothetical protein
MPRYAGLPWLIKTLRDPKLREEYDAQLQTQHKRNLAVARWIFILIGAGLAVLWLMNALGHPL